MKRFEQGLGTTLAQAGFGQGWVWVRGLGWAEGRFQEKK